MAQIYIPMLEHVSRSIDILQRYEPDDGYYVAFSGGKDSIVMLDLVIKAGVKYDAHFNSTSVDPPELIQFLKDNYPDIPRHKPEISMFQLIEQKGFPPTRGIRYCCDYLKEYAGRCRWILTGIRHDESPRRKKRKAVEMSQHFRDTSFVHPIIHWTNDQVWDYIKLNRLKYCSLYNEKGRNRIGCIMCPSQGRDGMLRDKERFPKYYRAYLRCFNRMIKSHSYYCSWKTAEEVMEWWIYGTH
jgi:phosphoadenosine phosphosulfate reductase